MLGLILRPKTVIAPIIAGPGVTDSISILYEFACPHAPNLYVKGTKRLLQNGERNGIAGGIRSHLPIMDVIEEDGENRIWQRQ